MKRALFAIVLFVSFLLLIGYIYILFFVVNSVIVWKIIISICSFIIGLLMLVLLDFSLVNIFIERFLYGFKFELLELSLIFLLLSFVIITVNNTV